MQGSEIKKKQGIRFFQNKHCRTVDIPLLWRAFTVRFL